MNFKLIVLLSILSGCLARRYQVLPDIFEDQPIQTSPYNPLRPVRPVFLERVRRSALADPPYKLTGGGGKQAGGPYRLTMDLAGPVWTSPNGQHTIGASGGFSSGVGAPDYRGGVGYTFRF